MIKKNFIKIFFSVIILLYTVCNAQVENSKKTVGIIPIFFYDAIDYRSTQVGKTRVDFYVQVPYKTIQFTKSDNEYNAHYAVTISVLDENNTKLITEKRWNEKINLKDFESTISKKNYFLSLKSFDLIPQNYFIRCEVEDGDSKKSYIKQDTISVKSFQGPITISDLMLLQRRIEVEGKTKFIPNVSKVISGRKDGVSIYYEIYSDTTKKVQVVYKIIDMKDEKLFEATDTVSIKKNNNPIYYSIKDTSLNIGEYKLSVNIIENGKTLASTEKRFLSRQVGLPNSVRDIDQAVDQMIYIAKSEELTYIKDAPNKEEKLKRFLAFWKAKDPAPATEENEVFEEYYRRVQYADEHFKHYVEGWRTDMGMVYITLGPPSNVERHPFEYDTKPYEVWDYYDINRRFIFLDETGFGDYRLLNPEYGSWWRYRD